MSDYICQNILFRIFKLLPVRSILRFRSVCKEWKELLDSDEFMHAHLALQNPQLLVRFRGEPQYFSVELRSPPLVRDLTTPLEVHGFSLVGTLHGVVCLYEDEGLKFLLWNPSIRKFSSIRLPFPLNVQTHLCRAFWIDPSSKEFKILVLQSITQRLIGNLYSSIKRAWTAIPPAEFDQRWICYSISEYAVIVAGIAHWKACYYLDVNVIPVMVCFDFTQESIEFIQMPHQGEIIQLQGMLAAVDWDGTTCQIHVRHEGLWLHMFSFNTDIPDSVDSSNMIILGLTEEMFWVLFKAQPELAFDGDGGSYLPLYRPKLCWYDTRVGCIPLLSDKIYSTSAYDFVESLLFP